VSCEQLIGGKRAILKWFGEGYWTYT